MRHLLVAPIKQGANYPWYWSTVDRKDGGLCLFCRKPWTEIHTPAADDCPGERKGEKCVRCGAPATHQCNRNSEGEMVLLCDTHAAPHRATCGLAYVIERRAVVTLERAGTAIKVGIEQFGLKGAWEDVLAEIEGVLGHPIESSGDGGDDTPSSPG